MVKLFKDGHFGTCLIPEGSTPINGISVFKERSQKDSFALFPCGSTGLCL